jgi:predicted component of type VI protein secretion system
MLNHIENDELKSLLSEIPQEKHRVSRGHKLIENSLISKTDTKKTDYLKFARDVLCDLEIKKLEKEINNLRSDIENLSKISDLKIKINKLKKNK